MDRKIIFVLIGNALVAFTFTFALPVVYAAGFMDAIKAYDVNKSDGRSHDERNANQVETHWKCHFCGLEVKVKEQKRPGMTAIGT